VWRLERVTVPVKTVPGTCEQTVMEKIVEVCNGQPVVPPPPPQPVVVIDEPAPLCFLIAGRQKDGGSSGNGFEEIAVADCDYLKGGTGLEPLFSQLVRQGFNNDAGVPEIEAINDAVQGLVVMENGVWQFYGMPRSDSAGVVPFWALSWLQYFAPGSSQAPNGGVMLCEHDANETTGWDGVCGGESQMLGWKVPLTDLNQYGDFVPYIGTLQAAMANAQPPFNQRIEVVDVFFK
jgi:hypothetical protein